MLKDPQVLGNDHNKPHSLMSDPISTMYFHNMSCNLLNNILFKAKQIILRLLTCCKIGLEEGTRQSTNITVL